MIGALKFMFGKLAGGTKPAMPGRVGILACIVPGGAPPVPGGGGSPGVPGAPVPGGIPNDGGIIPVKPGGIWGRPYSGGLAMY